MRKIFLFEQIVSQTKLSKVDAKKVVDVFFDLIEKNKEKPIIQKKEHRKNEVRLDDLLHPSISEVSIKLYNDKYYKESVHNAIIEVIKRVKKKYKSKTGKVDDGTSLMMKVFNQDEPIIRLFKEDEDDSKGMQEGYKYIFAGMVLAIRNPKAHGNFQIQEIDAIELLLFCSRLMRKLDNEIIPQ